MVTKHFPGGFSLVELLVSISILTLLLSVGFANVRQRDTQLELVGSEAKANQLAVDLQQLQWRALVGEQVDVAQTVPEQFIFTTTAHGYTLTTDQGTIIGQRQWPDTLISPVGCVVGYTRQRVEAAFTSCTYSSPSQTAAIITVQDGGDFAWQVAIDAASGLARAYATSILTSP